MGQALQEAQGGCRPVIPALSSSLLLGDGAFGYHSAVQADSRREEQNSDYVLPQPSSLIHSPSFLQEPPVKLLDLMVELDTVCHGMSPHLMHIEIPVAGNASLAYSHRDNLEI